MEKMVKNFLNQKLERLLQQAHLETEVSEHKWNQDSSAHDGQDRKRMIKRERERRERKQCQSKAGRLQSGIVSYNN